VQINQSERKIEINELCFFFSTDVGLKAGNAQGGLGIDSQFIRQAMNDCLDWSATARVTRSNTAPAHK